MSIKSLVTNQNYRNKTISELADIRISQLLEKDKITLNIKDPVSYMLLKVSIMCSIAELKAEELERGFCSYKLAGQCNSL